jgi:propionyl-CoA carboxylase alpha chain
VVAATIQHRIHRREAAIPGQLAGHARVVPTGFVVGLDIGDGGGHEIKVAPGRAILADGREIVVDSDWRVGEILFRGVVDGHAMNVQVDTNGVGFTLFHAGASVKATVLTPRVAELAKLMPVKKPPDTSRFLLSPMPGLLKGIASRRGRRSRPARSSASSRR